MQAQTLYQTPKTILSIAKVMTCDHDKTKYKATWISLIKTMTLLYENIWEKIDEKRDALDRVLKKTMLFILGASLF